MFGSKCAETSDMNTSMQLKKFFHLTLQVYSLSSLKVLTYVETVRYKTLVFELKLNNWAHHSNQLHYEAPISVAGYEYTNALKKFCKIAQWV